jgi:hypothetical protein
VRFIPRAASLSLVVPIAIAIAARDTSGQSALALRQSGGGLGESAVFSLTGGANRPYLLWCDTKESDFAIAPGVVAHVGFDMLDLSFKVPGFIGRLDAGGSAALTFGVPDDPALAGVVVSFQALYIDKFDAASNFTRLTPQAAGTFAPTLHDPLLPIVTGLASPDADGTVTILDTTLPLVYRYTPALEQFDVVDVSCALGLLSTFTALPDGRFLVTGGIDPTTGQPHPHALLFDPASNTCDKIDMATPRAGHAAAVDAKGEVVISGGFTSLDLNDLFSIFAGIASSTEIFDPVGKSFRAGPNLLEPKTLHSATATSDGRVLVAGGLTLIPFVNVPFVSTTGYLYDPNSDAFGFPLFFTDGRLLHGAALLDDKEILLAGGVNIDFSTFLQTGNPADLVLQSLTTGEVWKDGFLGGGFKHATGMQKGRALPGVAATANAAALVAGGFDLHITGSDITQWTFEAQKTADVYSSLAFTSTGDMGTPRVAPVITLLSDGTVLVAGGFALGAEIWQP